jgi:hypothetical protein
MNNSQLQLRKLLEAQQIKRKQEQLIAENKEAAKGVLLSLSLQLARITESVEIKKGHNG